MANSPEAAPETTSPPFSYRHRIPPRPWRETRWANFPTRGLQMSLNPTKYCNILLGDPLASLRDPQSIIKSCGRQGEPGVSFDKCY